VQNLSFAQKIELISWLSGETDVSESIAPLEGAAASAAAGDAAAIAGGKGVPMQKSVMVGGQKMVDARLLQIYDGERRMGDHNTALRGTRAVVSPPQPLLPNTRISSLTNTSRTSPPTAKPPQHSSAPAPPTPNLPRTPTHH
jgi:parafibromin